MAKVNDVVGKIQKSLANPVESSHKTITPYLKWASSPKKIILGESQYTDVKRVKEILERMDEGNKLNSKKIKFSLNPMHLHSQEKEHYWRRASPSKIVCLIEEKFVPKENEYCDGVIKIYPHPKEDLYIIDLTLGKFGPGFWHYLLREGSSATGGKSKPSHLKYRSMEIEFRIPKAS